MIGITSFAAYVPPGRLDRSTIPYGPPRNGTRAVAAHDQDSVALAVESARSALRGVDAAPAVLWFATASPPYLEKSNASIVHAALDLPEVVAAYETGGSLRSGAASLAAASRTGGMAIAGDVRIGRPGSSDEAFGGDAAATVVFGEGPDVVAELLARESATVEVLSRWRLPDERFARSWESRFEPEVLADAASDAASRVLESAGVSEPDHVALSAANSRLLRALRRRLVPPGHVDDLTELLGFCGAAQLGVELADALDRAMPGETILALAAADGSDAFLFRATAALLEARLPPSVRMQAEYGHEVSYGRYLAWRRLLEPEVPRRPEPEAPAPPPAARRTRWKYAFTGSTCNACGQIHLPPQRICATCGTADDMSPAPMSDRRGHIVTHTVDHLSSSPDAPAFAAVVDFESGGRAVCELADVDDGDVLVGTPVEMTFRRLHTSDGVHNYFWKARPMRSSP